MSEKSYSYEQAGVSIAAGNALVKAIAPLAKATARPGADAELGGFGGFFDLKAAGYKVAASYAGNDEAAQKFKAATGIPVFKWDVSNFEACAAGMSFAA